MDSMWSEIRKKGSKNSEKEYTIPGANVEQAYYCRTYSRSGIAGTPLAEVFSICINPTEECKVYGEIWVEDDKGIVDYLFNFDREEPTLISRGSSDNSLLLYQSKRAILASSYFKVHFDLKDGDSIFLKDTFSWSSTTAEDYDMVLDKTIVGEYGSAKMSYIVHSLAIEARICRLFYKSETITSSVHVKGTISACYNNMMYDFDDESDGSLECSRLKIFEGNGLEMNVNEQFPVDRNVMAVPLYYPFKIEVDLHVDDHGDGSEGGQVHWHGNVEFSSREIENWLFVDKEIEVANGCVGVRIVGINYARMSFADVEYVKCRLGLNNGALSDK